MNGKLAIVVAVIAVAAVAGIAFLRELLNFIDDISESGRRWDDEPDGKDK